MVLRGCKWFNPFADYTNNFVRKGYKIETRYDGFTVNFLPKRVIIQTDSNVVSTVSEETTKEGNFKITIASRFYEIISLVQELVNQEAEFCYTESLGIVLLYPEFNIKKFKTQDSIVYTVEHVDSKEKFRFAIKGCVIPPGF